MELSCSTPAVRDSSSSRGSVLAIAPSDTSLSALDVRAGGTDADALATLAAPDLGLGLQKAYSSTFNFRSKLMFNARRLRRRHGGRGRISMKDGVVYIHDYGYHPRVSFFVS